MTQPIPPALPPIMWESIFGKIHEFKDVAKLNLVCKFFKKVNQEGNLAKYRIEVLKQLQPRVSFEKNRPYTYTDYTWNARAQIIYPRINKKLSELEKKRSMATPEEIDELLAGFSKLFDHHKIAFLLHVIYACSTFDFETTERFYHALPPHLKIGLQQEYIDYTHRKPEDLKDAEDLLLQDFRGFTSSSVVDHYSERLRKSIGIPDAVVTL